MSFADFSKVGTVPEHLNLSVIDMWTHTPIHPEQFYRTGFESIFFNNNRDFALNCVLSSVVPAENEIVIAGQHHLSNVVEAAANLDIPHIIFDASPDELPLMETFLSSRTNISHIVLVLEKNDTEMERYIQHLRPLLEIRGIDLILYCTSFVQNISDRTKGGVDFFIGGWEEFPDNSFVVARRNRLVQTEGNSRSEQFDLYTTWQWRLRERGTNILPMEM